MVRADPTSDLRRARSTRDLEAGTGSVADTITLLIALRLRFDKEQARPEPKPRALTCTSLILHITLLHHCTDRVSPSTDGGLEEALARACAAEAEAEAVRAKLKAFEDTDRVKDAKIGELEANNEWLDQQLEIRQKEEETFVCCITSELMRDPVVTADGHTYERAAIERWLQDHDTSPKTNVVLRHKEVVPNHALKQQIADYRDASGLVE